MGKRKGAALKAQRTAGARWILPLLAAGLLALSLAALAVGPYPLSPGDTISLLLHHAACT